MRLTRRQFELQLATLAASTCLPVAAQDPPRPPQVPWLAEVQRPPAMLPPDAPRVETLLIDSERKPITSLKAWQQRRTEIREGWMQFLGSWETPRGPVTHQI